MEKTIAAISTSYGEAGIGIVRMSGPCALEILSKVFFKKNGKSFSFEPRHMYYGLVREGKDGKVYDEALAVYMKAPNTYTGEDVCEIQCHGGNLSVKNILSLLLRSGAELAEPGEFTKRAFLSGRMDLSQAEAVIDLIKAKTDLGFDTAVDQLSGSVSNKIKLIRQELLDFLVSLTVNMDYPDEDIEQLTYKNMEDSISSIYDELSVLQKEGNKGRILREGLRVAIVGKPNVGKSSLMNLLLGENRSIVTSVPGTTRDTIEECADVCGIPVIFTDTAGIHESSDLVESIGIERSKNVFNNADLLIIVLDASLPLSKEDEELLSLSEGRSRIIIYNKSDLGFALGGINLEGIKTAFKNGLGIDEVKKAIVDITDSGKLSKRNDCLLTNVRHTELVRKACEELLSAKEALGMGMAMDFVEVNVRAAFDYLGEITGDTASDEVINEVFSRFCLGK